MRDSSGTTLTTGETKRRDRSALAADKNSIQYSLLQNAGPAPAFVNRVGVGQSVLEKVNVQCWHSCCVGKNQLSDTTLSNLAVDAVVPDFVRSQYTACIKCPASKRRRRKHE